MSSTQWLKQQMILPRALLDANEQLVVFVDERVHQRAVIGRQQRNQQLEARSFRQRQQPREMTLALLAFLARDGDDAGLRVDAVDVFRQIGDLAAA